MATGSNGVPVIPTTLPKYVSNIASITNGVVTTTSKDSATPAVAHTIVMTPVATGTNLNWNTSGTICDADRGVKC